MIVELRSVPGCPNLAATRALLHDCLAELGLSPTMMELVGDYRSPSVLVDGTDVTGAEPDGPATCVLVLPTAEQIRAALLHARPAVPTRGATATP